MIKVVAALIIKGKKILLAERLHGELKGMWEFPGGKVEDNENVKDAIVREIREELLAEVEPNEIIGKFSHKYEFGHINLTLLRCEMRSNRVQLNGSHAKIKWVDYNTNNLELAPLDLKIFNYLKEKYDI